MTYNEGKKVNDWKSFQNAVNSVRTKLDGRKICEIIYLSLNFISSYRELIAKAVLASCNYKILKESKLESMEKNQNTGKATRKKRSFILKLISQMTTNLRKGINDQSLKRTGFQYTKKIPEDEVSARSKDKQSHLRFYDWMIKGEYVSLISYICIALSFTKSQSSLMYFLSININIKKNGKPFQAMTMKSKRSRKPQLIKKSSGNKKKSNQMNLSTINIENQEHVEQNDDDEDDVNLDSPSKRSPRIRSHSKKITVQKKTIPKKRLSKTISAKTKNKNVNTPPKKTNRRLALDEEDSTEDDYSIKAETEDEKYDDTEDENSAVDNNIGDTVEKVVTITEVQKEKNEMAISTRKKTRSNNKKQQPVKKIVAAPCIEKEIPPTVPIVTDDETSVINDKDYEWEIERDKDRQYYYSSNKKLNKKSAKLVDIVNHRKARGYEGELLVLYENGLRDWVFTYGVFEAYENEFSNYFVDNMLSLEQMEYESEKIKRDNEKKKKLEDAKREKEELKKKKKKKQKCKGTNKKTKKNDMKDEDLPLNENMVVETLPILAIMVNKNATLECQDQVDNTDTGTENHDIEVEQQEPIEEDTPFVCTNIYNHQALNLGIQECSKYCTNGNRFDGIVCALCGALFVDKLDNSILNEKIKKLKKPSTKYPMYCCDNSKEYCTYAICFGCRHGEAVILSRFVQDDKNKPNYMIYTK